MTAAGVFAVYLMLAVAVVGGVAWLLERLGVGQ